MARLAALVLVALLLVPGPAAGVVQAFRVTLSSYAEVGLGTPFPAWGSVTFRDPAGARPAAPFQPVAIYVDGARAGTAFTNDQGNYRFDPTLFTRGVHAIEAASPGLRAEDDRSRVVLVLVVDVPGAPRNLTATPGETWDVVELAWQPPEETGGGTIQDYTVWRSRAGGTFFHHAVVPGTQTRLADRVAEPGLYEYRVAARTAAGFGPSVSVAQEVSARPPPEITANATFRVCRSYGECSVGSNQTHEVDTTLFGHTYTFVDFTGRLTSGGVGLKDKLVTLRAFVRLEGCTSWSHTSTTEVRTTPQGDFVGSVQLREYCDPVRVLVTPEADYNAWPERATWRGHEIYVDLQR